MPRSTTKTVLATFITPQLNWRFSESFLSTILTVSVSSYHNEELKSLTRYRFDKVKQRARLKQSVSRLVTILFPELDSEIDEIGSEILKIMEGIFSPILTIPGLGFRMGAMILAEVGDFSLSDSSDKLHVAFYLRHILTGKILTGWQLHDRQFPSARIACPDLLRQSFGFSSAPGPCAAPPITKTARNRLNFSYFRI